MKVSFLLGLVAVCAFTSGASAWSFSDNFDSYADQTAFQAAWPSWATDGSSMNLLQGFSNSPENSINGVAAANNTVWNVRSLEDMLYTGTDANPVEFKVMMYDTNVQPYVGNRNFVHLRAYKDVWGNPVKMPPKYNTAGYSVAGLIALGLYNGTGAVTNQYATRIGFTWYTTQINRTEGWHELKAVIKANTVNIYVDGVLAQLRTGTAAPFTYVTDAPWGGFTFSGVVVGSGLTSAGFDAPFDDISVTPEPMTLLMLAAGGLFLRRRRTA